MPAGMPVFPRAGGPRAPESLSTSRMEVSASKLGLALFGLWSFLAQTHAQTASVCAHPPGSLSTGMGV
eukprot:3708597-Heterocapsa_arctica.AAC.1